MSTITLKTKIDMINKAIFLMTFFILFSCNKKYNVNIEKDIPVKTEAKTEYSDYYINCGDSIRIASCINSVNCGGISCITLSCGNICYTQQSTYFYSYKKCMNYLSQPVRLDKKKEIIDYHESMYRFINRKIDCVKRTQSVSF